MDLLKRELERKRKVLQEAKQKMMVEQPNSSMSKQHRSGRYMKTSDVRRILEEEEEALRTKTRSAAYATIENDIIEDSSLDPHENQSDTEYGNKKRKLYQNDESAARDGDDAKTDVTSIKQQQSLHTLESVQRELRLLGLPITYFGETSIAQRIRRLQQAQNHQSIMQLQEREADEFRLKQGFGIRNTFLEKESSDHGMHADFHNNTSNENDNEKNENRKSNRKKLKEATEGGSSKKEKDHKAADTSEIKEDDDKHKRIYKHFKGLLKQWESDLNERSDDVKRSLAGRNETKKVKQCKDYIRPLFQLCKRRQLEENMVQKLYSMVLFCEQGEFVRAHDAYMDIAIGRAAWPIGVTMVGIHARTGRAKIESSNVAHVMNSELQRKYLTSVKRLLTYEQNQRTDVDPSKKVR